jgi:hypothetical protein
MSGNIFINELLKDINNDDFVTIFSYRKFLSKKIISKMAWENIVSKTNILNKNIKTIEEIENINSDYYFCHPFQTFSPISFYSRVHATQDYLRFLSCAMDLNFINKQEINEYLNYSILIPGGTLFGKFPVGVYKEIMNKLELIIDLFLQMHDVADTDLFWRCRAFDGCCERFSSWLLIKHLEKKYSKSFIKNGSYFSWQPNLLIDQNCLNFNEFFAYLYCVNENY